MDDKIIHALGGTGAVAEALGQKSNVISNWRARGIPWRFRPAVAALAEQRGLEVPPAFLAPEARQ